MIQYTADPTSMLVYKRERSTTCAYRALCIVRVSYTIICNKVLHHITPPPNFASWWYTRGKGEHMYSIKEYRI